MSDLVEKVAKLFWLRPSHITETSGPNVFDDLARAAIAVVLREQMKWAKTIPPYEHEKWAWFEDVHIQGGIEIFARENGIDLNGK